MQNLKSLSFLSLSRLHYGPSSPTKSFILLFSSSTCTTLPQTSIPNPIPIPDPLIINYLIETFGLSKTRALSISNRFSWIKSTEKPQSVLQLLRHLGFSEPHIRSSVRVSPQILFSDIDKTLKPKLQFFQELGLVGSDLGKFISKNSSLLTLSLGRKLIPCIQTLKKVLSNDDGNRDLIQVLQRCKWVISKNPESRLLCNIAFLESCGIVGSQLSVLLKRQPRLFMLKEPKLRDLVWRVLHMGFSTDSRMLVHALYTVSCLSNETFRRKIDLFRSFGFSEDECMEMFKRTPGLLRTSEQKLKLGIEFFMNTIKFKKTILVHRPSYLMLSIKERVIPRYRVLQVTEVEDAVEEGAKFYEYVAFD
ncbi:hypothetical protein L1049_002880 [Liquidambar formosana]|uniref:Uncharacterized protein n=1 Tax=Liquidambar formosana TaxID=63359 RepID=A0AAP0NFT6_LIQFO